MRREQRGGGQSHEPPRTTETAPLDAALRVTGGPRWERVRRFTEEDAARILRSHARTEARDWAKDHRSTSAAAPMLSDAYGLRGTGAAATPLKGTDATASRHVRGTGDSREKTCRFAGVSNESNLFPPLKKANRTFCGRACLARRKATTASTLRRL